jgi:Fe2+ or Zn2+ uptake regulation protein
MDPRIEALQATIAGEAGYLITDHELHIYGVCSACREPH